MNDNCTVYKTTEFIGKRWTLVILLEIYKENNSVRYNQLKKNIKEITPKILSLRLKELEKEGIITKKIDASKFPVSCEYTLTKSGKEFIKIIKDIKKWALTWKYNTKTCQKTDCEHCEF